MKSKSTRQKNASKKSSIITKSDSEIVKVYSTHGCPWCLKTKDYLKQNKIKFEDIDVSSDESALKYIIGKSGEYGFPQTEINGKVLIGFDKEELDIELAKLKQ
jgi:glutaredoxin 3